MTDPGIVAGQRCIVIGPGRIAWREHGRIVQRPAVVSLRGGTLVVGAEREIEGVPGAVLTEAELLDSEPDPFEFLDDPVLAFSTGAIPMPMVIDALARHARLDAGEPTETLVIVHPTWWPPAHRRALAAVMRRYAGTVQLVSTAVACAAAHARRYPGQDRLVVIEQDPVRRVETILGIGEFPPRVLATSINDPDAELDRADGAEPRVDASVAAMDECLLDGAAGLLPGIPLPRPPAAWGSEASDAPPGRPEQPRSWARGLPGATAVVLLGGALLVAGLLLTAMLGGSDAHAPGSAPAAHAPGSAIPAPEQPSGHGAEATIGDLVIPMPAGWGMGWSDFADARDPDGFLAELLPYDHADERRILIARRGPASGGEQPGIAAAVARLVEADPRLAMAPVAGTAAEAAYREELVGASGALRGSVAWFVILVGGKQANIGCESRAAATTGEGTFPECLEVLGAVRAAG
ncbi:hypothetical protein HT102_07975 [Hoyosella sp. G463]|uniref:Type VII secretion-associated protein n=1 Tax=Lolliginicoccus lacisalsi TaxID=2742202 RepID=A0A927PL51_9ACTN|nr:hypothetical protein [Lolliginicoccus lacisalsi]MBD8506418.1 hypothetical protein [Lolliginicoccus lacisalsi]